MQVTFEGISIEAWKDQMKEILLNKPTGAIHLRALWQITKEVSQNQELMSDLAAAQADLGNILGRKPLTFGEEVASYYHAAAAK